MKPYEVILCIICISITHYVHIKCYSLIFKNEIKNINLLNFIGVLLITLLTYYNTFYNYEFTKIIISFIEMFLIFKIFFKDSIKQTIFKTLLIYFLGFLIEMILGILMAYFEYNSLIQIDNNIIFKVLFSILMMLIMYLMSHISFINIIFNKIYNMMMKLFNMTLLIILAVIVLVLLTYYLIITTDIYSILSIIFLIITLFILIFIAISQIIKTKIAIDKQEALLDFMKEYEVIIDKERIDRHEMVNNLLVLKGIKNKNSKSYNKILDDILLTYQSNKVTSGLYELPSGLKGLFYYKVYDMKNNNIETFINVSNKILKDLDKLDDKILTKVCKILGILLDNAKEAAKESKHKLVVIDLYKEKDNIIIYIENSMKNIKNLELYDLKIKGFSTKGNNRGYGLYLVDKLLNKNEKLDLVQEIKDDKFISILTIKNN